MTTTESASPSLPTQERQVSVLSINTGKLGEYQALGSPLAGAEAAAKVGDLSAVAAGSAPQNPDDVARQQAQRQDVAYRALGGTDFSRSDAEVLGALQAGAPGMTEDVGKQLLTDARQGYTNDAYQQLSGMGIDFENSTPDQVVARLRDTNRPGGPWTGSDAQVKHFVDAGFAENQRRVAAEAANKTGMSPERVPVASNEQGKEGTDKVKERSVANRQRRMGEAVKKTDTDLGIEPNEKDTSGLPRDESKRTEYIRALAENSEKAENQAVEDTVRQQYEEDSPPPKDGDPAKLAEWAKGYNDYKKSMNEAQQEAEQEAKATEGRGDGKKQTENTQKEVEKPQKQPDGAAKKEEEQARETEDNSASMGNAWKQAKALENAKDDVARKPIEEKIDRIHNANQNIRPRFKARVTIAKAVLIGRDLALMGALGVAGTAASQVGKIS
jgi:hypothetical protein